MSRPCRTVDDDEQEVRNDVSYAFIFFSLALSRDVNGLLGSCPDPETTEHSEK